MRSRIWPFVSHCAVLFLLATPASGHLQKPTQAPPPRPEEALKNVDLDQIVSDGVVDWIGQQIYKFDKASAQGDTETIKKMLADGFFHIDTDGKLRDRVDWLDSFKSTAAKLKANEFKWDTYRSEKLQVHAMRCTMAVATGLLTLKRSDSPDTTKVRFTQVWMRQDHWKMISLQGTSVSPQSK